MVVVQDAQLNTSNSVRMPSSVTHTGRSLASLGVELPRLYIPTPEDPSNIALRSRIIPITVLVKKYITVL